MALMRCTNKLREVRIQKGFSGYDLQILSHIPAQTIYLIERGLKRPQCHERALLADALQVVEEDIFPKYLERNPLVIDECHGV